ncbi:MAG: hypothetical protein CVV30_08580 [Methanomicrobiales archaeon HGW-Methanomicrobiales-1]|jgi:hypothetical protein|nr:MAG: hypothetical protein CVV30_08580 [Methanomicrobiales archaeon HGW-Methanomicrobiales-1]
MPNASAICDAVPSFFNTCPWSILTNIFGSLILGVLAGLLSSFLIYKYTAKQQIAIQLNENMDRCLFEITNNFKKLNDQEINEQLKRISEIVERKRKNRDLNEWAAFAKVEAAFSESNYYQYLLVDNIRYFILQVAPVYPKKSTRINEINHLYRLSEDFNSKLQDFERMLLGQINALILQDESRKIDYDNVVKMHKEAFFNYFSNFRQEYYSHYRLLDPEHPREIKVKVSLNIFNPKLY